MLDMINKWFDIAIVLEAFAIIAGIASLHIVTVIISMIYLVFLPFSLIRKSKTALLISVIVHVGLLFFLRERYFYSGFYDLYLGVYSLFAGFSILSYAAGRKLDFLKTLEGYPYFTEPTDEYTDLSYIKMGESVRRSQSLTSKAADNVMIPDLDTEKDSDNSNMPKTAESDSSVGMDEIIFTNNDENTKQI
ncbi:MAG: hypothetical protein Q4F95_01675 [Oscillospiraceae bacterium]|nr:hypothetical protein [Oscillospiraceae bacterium]